MGRKIEVKEIVNKDFNFTEQFLRPPLKWRPWHVPCLPYPRYVTARTPSVSLGWRESCACFRNDIPFFDLQVISYGQMTSVINSILF